MATNALPVDDLLFNPDKVSAQKTGKDGPAMKKVRENTATVDKFERENMVKTLIANYKSIPLTSTAKIDEVVKKNVEKSNAVVKDNAASKQQEADKERFKEIIETIFNGVSADFRNWAILMRAWEPELKKTVEEIKTKGQTADRRITQRGFFVFYLTNQELLDWLGFQVNIGITLASVIGKAMKTTPVAVPVGKDAFKALFDPNKITKVDRPPFGQAQDTFNRITKKDRTNLTTADLIEVFVILTPGRAILTRDEIRKSTHSAKFLTSIRELYDGLFKEWSTVFNLKAIKSTPKDSAEFNEAYRELISAIRMSIGQYRIMLFGETDRLGANEKRRFPAGFKLNVS